MAINHGALPLPPPSVLLNNEPKSPVLLCTGSDQRIYSLPVRDIDILAEFQVFLSILKKETRYSLKTTSMF